MSVSVYSSAALRRGKRSGEVCSGTILLEQLNLLFETVDFYCLTHQRPAMPFGNRRKYFRGSFQFSLVTIKKISPLWKPEI